MGLGVLLCHKMTTELSIFYDVLVAELSNLKIIIKTLLVKNVKKVIKFNEKGFIPG